MSGTDVANRCEKPGWRTNRMKSGFTVLDSRILSTILHFFMKDFKEFSRCPAGATTPNVNDSLLFVHSFETRLIPEWLICAIRGTCYQQFSVNPPYIPYQIFKK
jgi:hypothetical protein